MGDQPKPSSSSTGHLIDSLCDRFEAGWISGQPPRIEEYLVGCPQPARAVLLSELLFLDVHYRYRAGELVNYADYANRFPEDAPVVAGVCAQMPVSGTATNDSQLRDLAIDSVQGQAAKTVSLTVFCKRQRTFETALVTPLEVGRQQGEEPSPCCLVPAPSITRLIIAPREFRKMSRAHVRLEPLGHQMVRVTSLTKSGDIGIAAKRLSPDDSCDVTLPTQLKLGVHSLRLDHLP